MAFGYWSLRAGVSVALVVAAGPAHATLGEPAETAARDGAALGMSRQPPALVRGVAVHELRTTTLGVREFANPSGTVFAVAWSGLARPDLGLLLGTYHAEYRAAAAQGASGRGPRRVETGRVVVETWGHARNLGGRAYVPALVPEGVNVDDLR